MNLVGSSDIAYGEDELLTLKPLSGANWVLFTVYGQFNMVWF